MIIIYFHLLLNSLRRAFFSKFSTTAEENIVNCVIWDVVFQWLYFLFELLIELFNCKIYLVRINDFLNFLGNSVSISDEVLYQI